MGWDGVDLDMCWHDGERLVGKITRSQLLTGCTWFELPWSAYKLPCLICRYWYDCYSDHACCPVIFRSPSRVYTSNCTGGGCEGSCDPGQLIEVDIWLVLTNLLIFERKKVQPRREVCVTHISRHLFDDKQIICIPFCLSICQGPLLRAVLSIRYHIFLRPTPVTISATRRSWSGKLDRASRLARLNCRSRSRI